jgi:two-component system sensor histidine kinase KdpD
VQIDPGVPLVECDAVLIERVLANLLENAGKYTPAQSPVEVLVQLVDDQVHVSVRDHGPGVARAQEEIIFEKFTRGQAESATPGVGLGLAICRAIVEAHGGRIWVAPTHPQGATFTFSLPLGSPPAVDLTDDVPAALGGTQR